MIILSEVSMFYAVKLTLKSIISKSVIAYLSNTKIIFVDMCSFLKISLLLQLKNVDFVHYIVNNILFLTLGTPNFSSL